MPKHNELSTKVILQQDVKRGQALALNGLLATTGVNEPAGIAMADSASGEALAISLIGFDDVSVDGAYLGCGLDVADGNFVIGTPNQPCFAVVTAINGKAVEVAVGTGIKGTPNN